MWDACAGRQRAEAAAELLLRMSLEEERPPPAAAGVCDTPVYSSGSDGDDWGWSVLPEECKDLVIELMSMKELARTACICRELSQVRPSAPREPSTAHHAVGTTE